MSSFVIEKKEYIKAAGLVAGLSKYLPHFWLYDYESGRNSTPEDFYTRFSECHKMNALSVQDQYSDPTPETDDNEYKPLFNEYLKKGVNICISERGSLNHCILELLSFFNSALYQTEKESYYFKMQSYFYRIIAALVEKSAPESKSWGKLNI